MFDEIENCTCNGTHLKSCKILLLTKSSEKWSVIGAVTEKFTLVEEEEKSAFFIEEKFKISKLLA